MAKRVLVAYGSRYGSTAEIAERIGTVLADEGYAVDVTQSTDVKDVDSYDAVVVGCPVYSGEWLDDVKAFVKSNASMLGSLPTAIFAVSLRMKDGDPDLEEAQQGVFDAEKRIIAPVDVKIFAGALEYDKLSPIVALQAKTKGLPEGDFRDWEAVEAWAASRPSQFFGGSTVV